MKWSVFVSSKSVYSFGQESPLKLSLSDKTAKHYNQAAQEFFNAQVRFAQKHNRVWDFANDPIAMDWSTKQRKAWNEVARIFKVALEKQGPFHINDIMEDFLVKNVAEGVAAVGKKFGWGLTLAVTAGALYGALKGR